RSIGLFSSIEDIRRVVVASRNGKPIQVGDLARVETGGRPRAGMVAFNDREDVVQAIVQMTKGQNATKVVEDLKIEIARAAEHLPAGVSIVPYYDRTDLVRHTVRTVTENLAIGAALVVAILMLFLRNWHAALAVATVIPLSLLFAFVLMDVRGVGANLISLGSVDFGIIIDSAVVLVEALMVKLAVGVAEHNPLHSGYGWRVHTLKNTAVELGRPIMFSKAIIILA